MVPVAGNTFTFSSRAAPVSGLDFTSTGGAGATGASGGSVSGGNALGVFGVGLSASGAGGIHGKFGTEEYQSSWYVQMLDLVACDPNVQVVNIFHLIDEENLAGWQSGLYYADKSAKRSARAVRDWISRTSGRCPGTTQAWKPASKLKPPKTNAKAAKPSSKAKSKANPKSETMSKSKSAKSNK